MILAIPRRQKAGLDSHIRGASVPWPQPGVEPPGTRSAWPYIIALCALAGEWLVHQLEYAIEYQQRFGSVINSTPHRLYMAPLGVLLGIVCAVLLSITVMLLCAQESRRRRIESLMPERARQLLPTTPRQVDLRSLCGTAAFLAAFQTCIYVVQENLESAYVSGAFPGLSVLGPTRHLTAVPLIALVAFAISMLIWSIRAWRDSLRVSVLAAETLYRIAHAWKLPARTAPLWKSVVPKRCATVATRSPRSPPMLHWARCRLRFA